MSYWGHTGNFTPTGSRLALDKHLSSGSFVASTDLVIPIDFSTGTVTAIDTVSIGGGEIGNNGLVGMTIYGIFAAGRPTATAASARAPRASACVLAALHVGGQLRLQANIQIQNQNSETSQMAYASANASGLEANAHPCPYIAIDNTFAVDTTQD